MFLRLRRTFGFLVKKVTFLAFGVKFGHFWSKPGQNYFGQVFWILAKSRALGKNPSDFYLAGFSARLVFASLKLAKQFSFRKGSAKTFGFWPSAPFGRVAG